MFARYLIIGGGVTGLGAAYRLKEKGEGDYLILEGSERAGGLATSFQDQKGFWWDIGGHVQFSHYAYFDRAMEHAIPRDEWLEHERESWVWLHNRFVPYPFQNNIRYLPTDSLMKCLRGLLKTWKKDACGSPADFKEWILQVFGAGVADEFMLPYNYKVWAYPAEQMSYQWIGERVAVVDIERILENIVYERMDASWGPNNTFKFPSYGGTGAIWHSMADIVGREQIRFGQSVCSIDPDLKQVVTEKGDVYHYEHLLSTIPVDGLTRIVKNVPVKMSRTASLLKHSSSNIVGVGLKGRPPEEIGTKCWMYFPESNCPFYRVTVFSNYSPNNVPDPNVHYSLMTETSESPQKPVDRNKLVQETIAGLRATKLINQDDEIVSTWSHCAEYGYPTPSLERDDILDTVIPFLDKLGVYSRGRFGGWKYEVSNQDHSFMQGVEWVDWIRDGISEVTYKVNRVIDMSSHRLRKHHEPEELSVAHASAKHSAKSA
jgi:protoporphyrinogen oxidase